jgi:carbamoyl-phosphate synthase large subunit
LARELTEKGFKIYSTEHTAEVLSEEGIENVSVLHKVREVDMKPNITDYLRGGKIGLVINIPVLKTAENQEEILKDEYTIRQLAVEFNVPVITNLQLASALAKMLDQNVESKLSIRSLNEYMDSLAWNAW